jgi:hypothetical protein
MAFREHQRYAALRPAKRPARTLGLAARRSGIFLLITVTLVEAAFLTDSSLFLVLAFIAFMAVSGFLGYGIFDARQESAPAASGPARPVSGPAPRNGRPDQADPDPAPSTRLPQRGHEPAPVGTNGALAYFWPGQAPLYRCQTGS